MRTKTLLIAAAALAVGLASSQAQTVYSANIVGYVNVVFPGNSQFYLTANPFDNGTNTADSILSSLPNKSTIQTWDGVSSFVLATKSSSGFSPNPVIPVGRGFFVKVNGAVDVTNTYVGTVVPAPGGSTTNNLPNTLVLVGSALPVTGTLNDVGTNAINLLATLPNKSTVQTWDVPSQSFVLATKTSAGFSPNPTINVGQGFFLLSNGATNWTQTLAP